jgi:hypothetical protein
VNALLLRLIQQSFSPDSIAPGEQTAKTAKKKNFEVFEVFAASHSARCMLITGSGRAVFYGLADGPVVFLAVSLKRITSTG